MFGSISSVGRDAGYLTPVRATAPSQLVNAGQQPLEQAGRQSSSEDEQLMSFLRNITAADAAEVIALTQPDRGASAQSFSETERAYSEF
ncbi:MAG: hypothetical protein WBF87_15345 [Mesorhizobium sp.]